MESTIFTYISSITIIYYERRLKNTHIYSLLTTVWALYNHSSCLGTLTNVLVWAMFHKKIRQKEIHLLRHGISIFSELKELTESRRTEDGTD